MATWTDAGVIPGFFSAVSVTDPAWRIHSFIGVLTPGFAPQSIFAKTYRPNVPKMKWGAP